MKHLLYFMQNAETAMRARDLSWAKYFLDNAIDRLETITETLDETNERIKKLWHVIEGV